MIDGSAVIINKQVSRQKTKKKSKKNEEEEEKGRRGGGPAAPDLPPPAGVPLLLCARDEAEKIALTQTNISASYSMSQLLKQAISEVSRPVPLAFSEASQGPSIPAAALLALRSRDGELQILVAQNEVYNGYRSSPSCIVTNPFGGEFVFLGRRGAWNDRSPQDTLLKLLTETGFSIPTGGFRSFLFDRNKGFSGEGGNHRYYDIYNFVATEGENDWLQCSIETINCHFRQKVCFRILYQAHLQHVTPLYHSEGSVTR